MKTYVRAAAAAAIVSCIGFTVHTAQAACISGGAVSNLSDCVGVDKGSKDCLIGWSVNFDGAGNPPLDPKKGTPTTKVICTDGDSCDADGHVNGSCTFAVGVCLNAGAGTGSCTGANINNLVLKKPSAKDGGKKATKNPTAYFQRRTLTAETTALFGSAEACSADDLEVVVPLKKKGGVCSIPSGQKCSSDQDCDDFCIATYKKNKAVVKAIVDDGGSNKDADALKFFCLPNEAPAPTASCAEAFQIADPSDLIGGPIAQGRVGDWMLRNSDIRVIVRDVGRDFSFMVTNGGHIIDADRVRDTPAEDRDNFMGLQALVHIASTQATTNIQVLNDGTDCNPAILRTTGVDDLFDPIDPQVAIFQAGGTLSLPADASGLNLPVNLTTDYILRPDTNYVEIATTIENTGASDLELFVGDFLNNGGQLETFGPGLGFGEPLLRNGSPAQLGGGDPTGKTLNFLAGQGVGDARGVTYGVVFPRSPGIIGPGNTQDGTFETGAFTQSGVMAWEHGKGLLGMLNASPIGKPPGPFLVPAGGTNTLRRWFVVGETVTDVSEVRETMFGEKIAFIQGVVTSNGQPVANAHVTATKGLLDLCGGNCPGVVTSTLSDEFGFYRLKVSGNEYGVVARGPGHPYEGAGSTPVEHMVNVKGGKTVELDFDLPQAGAIRLITTDQSGSPIAAKVSLVGLEASPDPKSVESILGGAIENVGRLFGYDPEEKDVDVFGLAKVFFADHSGDTGVVPIEPGDYHVVVSHGPEYDAFDQPVTITAGATTTINATVNQVVDTTGFVSIETHVHMINSPDSQVTREDRIITMLAEGVDFFVPTDHDAVHDLNDDITAMGAAGLVASVPSEEITTFNMGHFNVWPLSVDPNSIVGGAADWGRAGEPVGFGYKGDGSYDLSPAELYALFNPATQVIQINHINSGTLGHFNNLGLDTDAIPPTSSNLLYRCVDGMRDGLPCEADICLGGSNNLAACTSDLDCPGGTCHAPATGRNCPPRGTTPGTCTLVAGNLASFYRFDPAIVNLYDDAYTALEVWIEASRAQTDLALHDNLADWVGLLNQGLFKAGTADSDTHQKATVQAGGPRTYVASTTDDPALIDANALALNVNAGRAVGSGGLFMRVSLTGDSGATASHALGDPLTVPATLGSGTVNVHVEAPPYAEFDTIEIYTNSAPTCVPEFTFFGLLNPVCDVAPDVVLQSGVDFTVSSATGVSGFGTRLVADVSQPLTVSSDTWVIVIARGTDGVSKPLFPFNPKDLLESSNTSLAALTDAGASPPWNLGEDGQLAMAFSNPLFFDFDGDGFCHGGTACP